MVSLVRAAAVVWLGVWALAPAPQAWACDACTTYCPADPEEDSAETGFQIGLTEQFTYSDHLRFEDIAIPNSSHLYLGSSATRFFVTYTFSQRLEVQTHLPILVRSFRRFEGADLRQQTVSGLGDVTALAGWTWLRLKGGDSWFRLKTLTGLKLPTGSTDLLDDAGIDHSHGGNVNVPDPRAAVHGHHLALGSGSLDGVLGLDALFGWKSLSFTAAAQYAHPILSRDDYQPGETFNWAFSGGLPVYSGQGLGVALRGHLSGEIKGSDHYDGVEDQYTGMHYVLAGPSVALSWDKMTTDIGIGFPLTFESGGTSIAPDYRLRIGFLWSL